MNPEQLRNYKLICACNLCGKIERFDSDRDENKIIKDGLPSNDGQPVHYGNNNGKNNSDGNNSSFMNFMAKICNNESCSSLVVSNIGCSSSNSLGPILDSGAPFSAIGVTELIVLRKSIGVSPLNSYDPIPRQLASYKYWKYGVGSQSSSKRLIMVYVVLNCRSDLKCQISIRHLVIQGSSQWLIGRNMKLPCNHLRIKINRIQFSVSNGVQYYLSMIDSAPHEFISLDRFTNVSNFSYPP